MTRYTARILTATLALTMLALPALAPADGSEKDSNTPKLVVIIIIDQFRPDYLARFRPYFVERGFNLLLSGAYFADCRYRHAVTTTAPGHATLLAGAYPHLHGIIGNEWYDRARARIVNCVEDDEVKPVTQAEGSGESLGASPRHLVGSTLGDELRFASGFQSRVVSISLKDRGAILPGGHTANAAYWYDSRTGHFVSSSYYMPALPAWVTDFNSRSPLAAYCGQAWQALPETPGAAGKTFRELTPNPPEPCPGSQFLRWIDDTPFMNEFQLRFALEAVKNDHLGEDSATDLLIVGLSVNDYIGHAHGPYSPEVADLTLRTDRYLADFFSALDKSVGLENIWIALSADHGVSPTPAFIQEHRLGLGNTPTQAVVEVVEEALSRAFGSEKWVESLTSQNLYLNEQALSKRRVTPAQAEAVAAEAAMGIVGVAAAFTRTQLMTGALPDSPLAKQVARSFFPQRSGNLVLVREPYSLPKLPDTDAAHGSPWNYDAQVPLLLWGKAFKAGVYAHPCEPLDLAPTLAVALGLNQPSGAEGRPLVEALSLESAGGMAAVAGRRLKKSGDRRAQ